MRALGLVAALAVLCACAHTHVLPPVPSPALEKHFTNVAMGAQVRVETTDGGRFTVAQPVMSDGAVLWYDSAAQRTVRRPLTDFRELRLTNDSHGPAVGALIGAGLGLAAGLVVFSNVGDCQPHCSVSGRLPVFATIPAGAFLGLIVGSAAGAPETFMVGPIRRRDR